MNEIKNMSSLAERLNKEIEPVLGAGAFADRLMQTSIHKTAIRTQGVVEAVKAKEESYNKSLELCNEEDRPEVMKHRLDTDVEKAMVVGVTVVGGVLIKRSATVLCTAVKQHGKTKRTKMRCKTITRVLTKRR